MGGKQIRENSRELAAEMQGAKGKEQGEELICVINFKIHLRHLRSRKLETGNWKLVAGSS